MKKEITERYLLLEQSGELGWLKKRVLRRELARSETARALQAELRRMTTMKTSDESLTVSEFSINRILDEGGRLLRKTKTVPVYQRPFFALWRPALIYSTAVIVLAAGLLYMTRQSGQSPVAQKGESPSINQMWDDGLDEEISELDTLLASTSEGDWDAWEPYSSDESLDSEAIAKELLLLEGEEI